MMCEAPAVTQVWAVVERSPAHAHDPILSVWPSETDAEAERLRLVRALPHQAWVTVLPLPLGVRSTEAMT